MQLSTFQDGVAAALMPQGAHPADTAPWLSALRSQPGFAVYRNTVHKACIDALQANYPTVCALVGEEWFRAAAGLFVQARPPTDGRLMAYGEGFAHFLQGFEAAAGLPYLPAVARLDRCWTESHLAADAPCWTPPGWPGSPPKPCPACAWPHIPPRAGPGARSTRPAPCGSASARAHPWMPNCRGRATAPCSPAPRGPCSGCRWHARASPSWTPALRHCPWSRLQPMPSRQNPAPTWAR